MSPLRAATLPWRATWWLAGVITDALLGPIERCEIVGSTQPSTAPTRQP